MKQILKLRDTYEQRYDSTMLTGEEIELIVEQFLYKGSLLGVNPEEVWEEAEILEKTLTFSSLYNYKHCHLKVVN